MKKSLWNWDSDVWWKSTSQLVLVFKSFKEKSYWTPSSEIKVCSGWWWVFWEEYNEADFNSMGKLQTTINCYLWNQLSQPGWRAITWLELEKNRKEQVLQPSRCCLVPLLARYNGGPLAKYKGIQFQHQKTEYRSMGLKLREGSILVIITVVQT